MPEIQKQSKGTIINIGSISSFEAGSGFGYVSTKHAVIGFTKELAKRYGNQGINCNVICPGCVENKTLSKLVEKKEPFRNLIMETPAQRLATTAEIGKAAVYLASEDASLGA